MKNTLLAILIIVVLVLGFFLVKGKNKTVINDPTPQANHEYSNNEYGFYVDLKGRVVTQKTAEEFSRATIYFDKPNGERDFVVNFFTDSEWTQYWNSLWTTYTHVGTVTKNGITFEHYTKPAVDSGVNDPQTLHYYIAQQDGLYPYHYEIYTTNPSLLDSFGLLQ